MRWAGPARGQQCASRVLRRKGAQELAVTATINLNLPPQRAPQDHHHTASNRNTAQPKLLRKNHRAFFIIFTIRYLSHAFLMAEQEWQNKHDIAARVQRDRLRAELDALIGDPAPMGASAATTDSA